MRYATGSCRAPGSTGHESIIVYDIIRLRKGELTETLKLEVQRCSVGVVIKLGRQYLELVTQMGSVGIDVCVTSLGEVLLVLTLGKGTSIYVNS